jgi:TfoX/Sxy family transcriptional regulator of competence genes
MAYNKTLAERVRTLLKSRRGIVEKSMFGGAAFLLNDHIGVGVWKEFLIVRLGVHQADEALNGPGVKPFDITGRPMKGWVMIETAVLDNDEDLTEWVEKAIRLVRTLPPKRTQPPIEP